MADIDIHASQWRFVEVGRVVLFTHGPYTGRLAAIVEIIDHKRALVDGPSTKEKASVPRQSVSLNNLIITPHVIKNLPRQAGRGAVARAWEKEEVEKKWEESAWAKRREQREKRRNLSDFDRFKVLRLKKQARFEVRKAHAKVKQSAKSS
ncbi:large subunit ribosomal protein L14e, partial [Lecanoromycetidae sp. Uapishka_2]